MSRNLRHRSNTPPAKKRARRSSTSTDISSSSDYDGVDAISDSEEDEPDVEEVEEQAIIESEDYEDFQSTPRPSIEDDQSSWDGFDPNTQEDILGGNIAFFDEHITHRHALDHDTEAAMWSTTNGLSESDTTRHVRFDLDDDSSSTMTDNEDDIFPDIFVSQNSLDPGFLKAIENNQDEEKWSSDGEGSYWDFNGDEPGQTQRFLAEEKDEEDSESSSSAGSSGYETDEGETTEEDLPPAASYVRPGRSVLRRSSTDSASEEEITIARRTSFRNHTGPYMASWKRNRTKPFVVTASNGKKLIMFKAEISPRKYSYNSESNLPLPMSQQPGDKTPVEELSPMISNSANLMMSAMYTPLDQLLMGGQALGPPEAFFPFTNIEANGSILQDSPSSYDEEDVDDEDLWRLEDLIDFNTADSDGETEQEDSVAPSSTPARPATSTSVNLVNPLLVNPRLVGAFRNNQDRHQLLSRNKASRESLAFSGPLNQGPIRGIKDNRLAAANTPITPLRRRRAANAHPPSPASPLVRHQNKRKFSGEEPGHKRSRTLA